MPSENVSFSGAQPRQPTARESGFDCVSPVVASRSFLGIPSASTLTRRPAPGLFHLGFLRGGVFAEETAQSAGWQAKPRAVHSFKKNL